jgi:hypothetical protein
MALSEREKEDFKFLNWIVQRNQPLLALSIVLQYLHQKEQLLALAPLMNEEELGAQQHVKFIKARLVL